MFVLINLNLTTESKMTTRKTKLIKPLEGVILEPNVEKFTEARLAFGQQEKAAQALGFANQTIISNMETERVKLTPRNYSLMLLLAQQHDNYALKARSTAKSVDDFIIIPKEGLDNIAGYLVELRGAANLTQEELAEVLDCSELTIRSYENGLGKASERFYTTMMLIFNKHPYFYLEKK